LTQGKIFSSLTYDPQASLPLGMSLARSTFRLNKSKLDWLTWERNPLRFYASPEDAQEWRVNRWPISNATHSSWKEEPKHGFKPEIASWQVPVESGHWSDKYG
jgi:hypothetical protein